MLRVKETESFPGGGVRGRWKMELTSKLTRRQRGGLIKGAFVIANCVFGGLHRLPSNKPAIYSLRHAHRMSMSWIRLQRKPTKTAVSGCNLLENSANFANPISRLDPNKYARVTYREINSPFQTWPFCNANIRRYNNLFFYCSARDAKDSKIFRIFFIRTMSKSTGFPSTQMLRCFWFIVRFVTGTKRLFVYGSWNVTVALFRNHERTFL